VNNIVDLDVHIYIIQAEEARAS